MYRTLPTLKRVNATIRGDRKYKMREPNEVVRQPDHLDL